jgi:hypothetical protein
VRGRLRYSDGRAVAWRKAASGPAAAEVAEIAAYLDELEAAGPANAWAADRAICVQSWLAMIAAAGGDPDVAALFLEFARDDRREWLVMRGGVA